MPVGRRRTMVARIEMALGLVCAFMGLMASLTDHLWKLGPLGWFTGGTLPMLIALGCLLDGAIAGQRTHLH